MLLQKKITKYIVKTSMQKFNPPILTVIRMNWAHEIGYFYYVLTHACIFRRSY